MFSLSCCHSGSCSKWLNLSLLSHCSGFWMESVTMQKWEPSLTDKQQARGKMVWDLLVTQLQMLSHCYQLPFLYHQSQFLLFLGVSSTCIFMGTELLSISNAFTFHQIITFCLNCSHNYCSYIVRELLFLYTNPSAFPLAMLLSNVNKDIHKENILLINKWATQHTKAGFQAFSSI